MSLVEEVGAQVRAGADELPVAGVTAGLARLQAGLDLLRWARQESNHELGTDRLAVAVEHLENAGRALLVAQDQFAAYLTTIGLTRDGAPATPSSGAGPGSASGTRHQGSASGGAAPDAPLGDWWSERVAVLTDTTAGDDAGSTTPDPDELLLRIADRVRAGDRSGLAGALGSVKAHVGLALAALAPTQAYHAATNLLGHPPTATDLPRLSAISRSRIGALLPGLPDEVVSAQLARVCRAPAQPSTTPIHPADSAVAGAVLVGVLLQEGGSTDERPVPPQEPRVRS